MTTRMVVSPLRLAVRIVRPEPDIDDLQKAVEYALSVNAFKTVDVIRFAGKRVKGIICYADPAKTTLFFGPYLTDSGWQLYHRLRNLGYEASYEPSASPRGDWALVVRQKAETGTAD